MTTTATQHSSETAPLATATPTTPPLPTTKAIDGIDFAKSEKYGYVTSCPSNLGTGMRASVHVKVSRGRIG